MAATTTTFRTHGSPGAADSDRSSARRIVRRQRLPSGRAVFGALLVTSAFTGSYLLTGDNTSEVGEAYVIARTDIGAGEIISAEALTTEVLVLPDVVDARAFHQTATLLGAVAVAPLSAGDLVQQSDVREGFDADVRQSTDQLTLEAPLGRTPPGLTRGENVMILATLGSGADAITLVVAETATVVDIHDNENPLSNKGPTITVSLGSRDATIGTANAAINGELTIVRASPKLSGIAAIRVSDQTQITAHQPEFADGE